MFSKYNQDIKIDLLCFFMNKLYGIEDKIKKTTISLTTSFLTVMGDKNNLLEFCQTFLYNSCIPQTGVSFRCRYHRRPTCLSTALTAKEPRRCYNSIPFFLDFSPLLCRGKDRFVKFF